MKEKDWIRGQLEKLMDVADPESLWLVLVFARNLIK